MNWIVFLRFFLNSDLDTLLEPPEDKFLLVVTIEANSLGNSLAGRDTRRRKDETCTHLRKMKFVS